MRVIPDACENTTDDISDNRRDYDDRNGSGKIKRLYDDRNADHMRPLAEIDERLRPSKRDEDRPHQM